MRKIKRAAIVFFMTMFFLICAIICSDNVYAANDPNALALGFELDTSDYKDIGWVSEKTAYAYFTDDAGKKLSCGALTSQTLYATRKAPFLTGYEMDVWLTRSITEAFDVSAKMVNFWWFKNSVCINFYTTQFKEEDIMPDNIKLEKYYATTPSQLITKTVSNGLSIGGEASIEYKNVKIGANSGVSWEKSSAVTLCSPYNESRTSKFKITYSMQDPYYTSLTQKQQSYLYGMNYFYTAKYVYGTTTVMSKYTAPTDVWATFKGHFNRNILGDGIEDVVVSGGTKISVRAAIGR